MGNLGLRPHLHSSADDNNEMNHHLEKLLRVAYSYSGCTVQLLKTNLTRDVAPPLLSSSLSLSKSWESQNQNHQVQLMAALDKCTSDDVSLSQSIEQTSKGLAPVGYINLHENKWFSLGIFIIYKGGRIPLHDHPGMFGMLKVIHGKVRIKSYTVTDQVGGVYTTVTEERPILLDPSNPPCFLGPKDKNIHEIEYVDNPHQMDQERPYASFIDFLCPPYTSDPEPFTDACNYYEVVRTQGRNHCVIQKCQTPKTYWSEDLPYTGHSLDAIIEELQSQYPESF